MSWYWWQIYILDWNNIQKVLRRKFNLAFSHISLCRLFALHNGSSCTQTLSKQENVWQLLGKKFKIVPNKNKSKENIYIFLPCILNYNFIFYIILLKFIENITFFIIWHHFSTVLDLRFDQANFILEKLTLPVSQQFWKLCKNVCAVFRTTMILMKLLKCRLQKNLIE